MELTDTTAAMATLRAALADGVEKWKNRVQALAREIHAHRRSLSRRSAPPKR